MQLYKIYLKFLTMFNLYNKSSSGMKEVYFFLIFLIIFFEKSVTQLWQMWQPYFKVQVQNSFFLFVKLQSINWVYSLIPAASRYKFKIHSDLTTSAQANTNLFDSVMII